MYQTTYVPNKSMYCLQNESDFVVTLCSIEYINFVINGHASRSSTEWTVINEVEGAEGDDGGFAGTCGST